VRETAAYHANRRGLVVGRPSVDNNLRRRPAAASAARTGDAAADSYYVLVIYSSFSLSRKL
jgi:hypothetical protein